MTTDIQVVSAPDLSVSNSVMNFVGSDLPSGFSVAGASWLVEGRPPIEAVRLVARRLLQLVAKKLSNSCAWLIVGNSAWQPDTRLVRHNKLWGALEARGIDIPHGNRVKESVQESQGRLKFFGAAQVSEFSAESAATVLVEEQCAYIVVLQSHVALNDILAIGWSGRLTEDTRLIERVIDLDGLLFKKIGEFDDKQWGLLAVGDRANLAVLLT